MAETQLAGTQMDDPDDAETFRPPAASPMGPGASITLSGPGGAVAGAPSPTRGGGAVQTSAFVEPTLAASPLADAPTQPVPVAGATTAANVHVAPAGDHPEPAVDDDDATTVGEASDEDVHDDAADFAGATMAAPYGDPDDPDSDSDATQAPEGYEETPPASPAPPPLAPDDDTQPTDADADGFVTALSTPAPAAGGAPGWGGGTPAPPAHATPPHPEPESASPEIQPPTATSPPASDDDEVADAAVEAALGPVPAEVEGDVAPDTLERMDAAIEAAFEAERREHPDAELRDPEDDETANANPRSRSPVDDPVERPRGSVDAAAVSSGAIVGADVNASEAWRVAGAAYYDTQRTTPEEAGAESSVEPAAAEPEPRTEPEKPRAAYSAERLRRMNVGCEAAPAGMDFDREEARADVEADVDAEPAAPADAEAVVPVDAESTPPRASAGAAPSTAREENPPPAASPVSIMDSESQELAGTPPAWSAYHYGANVEPSPAPATEEKRDEKEETEEEPPARTARPRRAAAAAVSTEPPARTARPRRAAAAAAAAAAAKDEETKRPKPGSSRASARAKTSAASEKRPASKRGAGASDPPAPTPKRQKLRGAGADDVGVRVLLSAAYDAKQTSKFASQVERLGGALAASASDFTHFVTAPPLVRSKNLLCALASGRPVVLPSWLEASSRAGRFAPTEDHLCRHPAFEKKHGFDLSRTLEAARAARVLSGVRAYVVPAGKTQTRGGKRAGGKGGGEGGADAEAAREMLAAVLPAAGADVATRSSEVKKATDDALAGDEWLIVAPVDADGGEIERLKVRGARVHGVEAVLSAVVRHKMDRTAHLVA